MNAFVWAGVALATSLAPAPANTNPEPATPAAATAVQMQPPMNSLDFAFYNCEGAAMQVMYDGDAPTHATLVTSDNKKYVLARAPAASGVQFASGPVKFWTDRKSVVVEGTKLPVRNCRMKAQ